MSIKGRSSMKETMIEQEFKGWGLRPSDIDKKIAQELRDFWRRCKRKR